MQINTSPVLNLSTAFENEVFEKESLGITEHRAKIFSKKNDNFIKNEEVFAEFKKCLAFENNRYCVKLPFKNDSEVLPYTGKITPYFFEKKIDFKSDIVARISSNYERLC